MRRDPRLVKRAAVLEMKHSLRPRFAHLSENGGVECELVDVKTEKAVHSAKGTTEEDSFRLALETFVPQGTKEETLTKDNADLTERIKDLESKLAAQQSDEATETDQPDSPATEDDDADWDVNEGTL